MRLPLALLFAALILTGCGPITQRAVPFDAACTRSDWAEACRIAPADWRDPENGLDAQARAALGWRIAQAQAAAGRLVEADVTWLLVAATGFDPEAVWEAARIRQHLSKDEQSRVYDLFISQLRPDENQEQLGHIPYMEWMLERHLNGELTAGFLGDNASNFFLKGHRDEAFVCGLLASDLHALETGDRVAAAKIAQLIEDVSNDGPLHSQACLREARLFMDLDRWQDAERKLALVEDAHLARPGNPLPALRERLRGGLATVAPAAPLDPPPPGLEWRASITAGLAGIEPIWANNGVTTYAGAGWRLDIGPDNVVFTTREELSPVAAAGTRVTVGTTPVADGWDGQRHACLITGPDGLRAVLFANGDVFFGSYLFLGRGLYLSPGREAALETCRFGLPLVRAQTIASVLDSAPVGDNRLVRAQLGDGGIYHGWITGGDAPLMVGPVMIDYPGLGFFLGSFGANGVEEGGFRRDDGGREIISGGAVIGCSGADGTVVGRSNLDGDQELRFSSGISSDLSYFDARTGLSLWYDHDSRYHHRKLDTARLRAIAERKAQEERQREANANAAAWARQQEEERAEEERYRARQRAEWEAEHPNWRQEEAEEQTRAELEAARSNQAFQFMPDETSDACIRCGGAGYEYVAGDLRQNGSAWIPDPLNSNIGSWSSGTVRTTASVQVCHWCNGSGRR
jgi:hypothetical protein